MSKDKILKTLFIQLTTLFLLFPFVVCATETTYPDEGTLLDRLDNVADYALFNTLNYSPERFSVIIGRFIAAAMGILGFIFIAYILYGGIKWMRAEGNKEEVEKAQKTIRDGAVGLGIVIFSASIAYFFFYLFTVPK